jgi:hypothetical protein
MKLRALIFLTIYFVFLSGCSTSSSNTYSIIHNFDSEITLLSEELSKNLATSSKNLALNGHDFELDHQYVSALGESCLRYSMINGESYIIFCKQAFGWYQVNDVTDVVESRS